MLDAGDGLWLVVADVSEAKYGEAAIAAGLQDLDWVSRRAVAHEAIVEQFLSAPAVLPAQLFTIFRSDERALQHVRRDRRRIDRVLDRVEGHVEWGVRLTWDAEAARTAVRRARAARTPASGADYLARRRDLLEGSRARFAAARREAARVFAELARLATDAVRRKNVEQAAPGSRLLLDAAYLVPAKRSAPFRAALRKREKQLRAAGLAVSLTGPWPAYHFVA